MSLVDAAGAAVVLPAQQYGSTLAPWAGTAYMTASSWTGEAGFIVTIGRTCDGPEITSPAHESASISVLVVERGSLTTAIGQRPGSIFVTVKDPCPDSSPLPMTCSPAQT
jgi:hypothetical protein